MMEFLQTIFEPFWNYVAPWLFSALALVFGSLKAWAKRKERTARKVTQPLLQGVRTLLAHQTGLNPAVSGLIVAIMALVEKQVDQFTEQELADLKEWLNRSVKELLGEPETKAQTVTGGDKAAAG